MKKDLLNNSLQQSTETEFSQMAEMVLNESIMRYRQEKLRGEIDKALLKRDKKEFMRLAAELNEITLF